MNLVLIGLLYVYSMQCELQSFANRTLIYRGLDNEFILLEQLCFIPSNGSALCPGIITS